VNQGFGAWLIEKAPWAAPWIVGFLVLYAILSVASHWPLLKYGTRHWRVTRKWEFRKWKRKNGR
jgi:hypothetical protein